ncbi:Cyclin-P1-1 [Colletotrichum gloeosporioides]|uniref:Cyclin-P1-1 n=1 Tax=Colletotrichum gloeosporioides TaxID=474922 RepID=A0A8H4FP97_COLGL|nr:Cyclin-P1-1 [Colletotrichum gloeosporioides]KAF3808189.1 Cyclin-P1-1 [Colletotrichum gloeosporioides]
MLAIARAESAETSFPHTFATSLAPSSGPWCPLEEHHRTTAGMTPKPEDGAPLQPTESNSSEVPELPPPPNPSLDPRLAITDAESPPNAPENDDVFKLSPRAAMRLLSGGIEALVRITGDIPPTPPPTSPTLPNMRGMTAEKELIRTNSEKNLARMRQEAEAAMAAAQSSPRRPTLSSHTSGSSGSVSQLIDGVHLRQTQTPTPPPPSRPPEPYIIIGENSQPINLQHSAITRKFYSKKPPPISIEEYLTRIHRFCPMSTAVYLATSLYIHRLAVEERTIPVTRRNAHRLVLAGLRVAMKALEDLSYPHSKMAKVGGVSELELARLEISFCFLANFELVAREDTLKKHWEVLKTEQPIKILQPTPTLSLNRKPRDKTFAGKENEWN